MARCRVGPTFQTYPTHIIESIHMCAYTVKGCPAYNQPQNNIWSRWPFIKTFIRSERSVPHRACLVAFWQEGAPTNAMLDQVAKASH